MADRKIDIGKLMATMSQTKEKSELPFAVEKRDIEIPYITRTGETHSRAIRIFIPESAHKPMPLVFIAHYEMTEDSAELILYLEKGWAVCTSFGNKPEYNGRLMDDNLVFNSAALSVARKQPDIDRTRIAVVGGSAGGYTTLMLSALKLGICCSVSFSGITNVPYAMDGYFNNAHSYNLKALAELSEEELGDLMRVIAAMPIPILGAIYDQFTSIGDNFPDHSDMGRWAAFSPCCLADCFSNPILFSHFTSDVLVPIDQLTKKFTYEKPGASLPKGFRLRLSEFPLHENFQRSMAEVLPQDDLSERLYPAPEGNADVSMGFDISKRYNIAVFDEGPVEAAAGHQKNLAVGKNDATAYLEAQFALSSRLTNRLTSEKLAMLAERYEGRSVQLPSHANADKDIYGSLAMYRQEVLDELDYFVFDCGGDALGKAFKSTATARPELAATLEIIKAKLR